MASKFTLKWNSHHAETFRNFDLLRNREMFVDITLSCSGQTMKAHKLVLCSGSSLFEKLLQRDNSACPIIHFHGMDMLHLKLLVDFMYLGEVDVPSCDLEAFFTLADSLEVKGIKGDQFPESDASSLCERPEMQSIFDKPKMNGQGPIEQSRVASGQPSTSGLTWKRRLPSAAVSSAGLQDLISPASACPIPEKRSKPALIVPDDLCQVSDRIQPEDLLKAEDEEIEEVEQVEVSLPAAALDGGESYYVGGESIEATEGDSTNSSQMVEGEEFDTSELPPDIPPEVAPETVTRGRNGIWSGKSARRQCRVYFCTDCTYSSSRSSNIIKHSRIHTGERPFACHICCRSFTKKESLKNHMKYSQFQCFESAYIKMANKYNLKWNSHHSEIFNNFDILRSRGIFVDVTLSCGGQMIKAHKLVLCCGSTLFKNLLQKDNSTCPIIHFHGIDMMHLRLLVDFMYMGEVDVPSTELEQFIALADNLGVKGLKADESHRSDVPPSLERSETQSTVGRQQNTHHAFEQSLGASVQPSTSRSSSATRTKRRIPLVMDSSSRSQDVGPSHSPLPVPVKKPKPELIVPDVPSQVSEGVHSEELIKTESEETEENQVEDGDSSNWTGDEGGIGVDCDESSSYQVEEGEELNSNKLPASIPSGIVPESLSLTHPSGVWCGQHSSGVREFFCTFCPYKSYYKHAVVRHSRIHTGEKPFECQHCHRAFARSSSLKLHMSSLHREKL
ncbi:unnamed protein product [Darwinula stevensoni]|uniref:Uncharacterized protein n=1 Tax=Darwinula stevensoni TaxID=69355 RepID=A0A7R8XAW7_9CRUS|nr:unnamed protein product [Darwinula stevensoni]CAG0890433.1 unnamed protein product [Darwinula stevensoni]